MNKEYFTTGELAKLTDVSYKTIRHYNNLEILKPVKTTEAGYRLYNSKSVETLQKILMLKYLNFSLDEIKSMITEEDLSNSFQKQETLLAAQSEHLNQLLAAVQAIQMVPEDERWEKLLNVIHMTQRKEEIIKQYMESTNLKKRINIHMYSTSDVDWYDWVLSGLHLGKEMKILDLGCGIAKLWSSKCELLPSDLTIMLIDNSEEMLRTAKKELEQHKDIFTEKNINFRFMKQDLDHPEIPTDEYDRIIANHMLYHVSNESRPNLLKLCASLLKADGMFYASTVGRTHLDELHDLVAQFDKRSKAPKWLSAGFELENGREQLEQAFFDVHSSEQKNDLLVPDPKSITDYVCSLPGNMKEILEERKTEWETFINNRVSAEKPLFIHKSTGAFWAYKGQAPAE